MMKRAPLAALLALVVVMAVVSSIQAEEAAQTSAQKASAKTEAYRAWLLKNGARMDNLEFSRVAGHGTTVVPPTDLKRGASLAFIPKHLVVTLDTVLTSNVGQFFQDESPINQAALWLLEQVYTPESFWKPYINMLPKSLPLTIFWSEEDLETVRTLPVYEWTVKRLATITTKYRAFFLPENRRKPYPESLKWMDDVTEEEWKWALGIMWSRGMPGDSKYEGNLVLIPIEDMFTIMNPESVEPHVRVRMSFTGLEFISNTDIARGSVIEKFESAAFRMSNQQLAFQYGVVFETNKNDRLPVVSCAWYDEKQTPGPKWVQLLKTAKCDAKHFLMKNPTDLKDLFCAARIVSLKEGDLDNATLVARATGRRMVSPSNEMTATTCLGERLYQIRMSMQHVGKVDTVKELLDDDKFGYRVLPANRRRALRIVLFHMDVATQAFGQVTLLKKQAGLMYEGTIPFPPLHEKLGRRYKETGPTEFPADDAKAVTSTPLSANIQAKLRAKKLAEKEKQAKEAAKTRNDKRASPNADTTQATEPKTSTIDNNNVENSNIDSSNAQNSKDEL